MMNTSRMTKLRHLAPALLLPLVLGVAMAGAQAAEKKASSPFQGFSSDNGKPVDVKSDALEVHQDEQKAIFTGNVVATQGESVLHTNELTVFYDNAAVSGGGASGKDSAAKGTGAAAGAAAPASATAPAADANAPAKAAPADGTAANSIKKLIARGNVVVTSKDQKATGDDGVFDMATNTATLTGSEVVMVQGSNVVKGKKLVVNLKTGVANVMGGTTGLFVPNNQQTPQKSN